MAKKLNRTETTHIDEVGRSAKCTLQWLLEECNEKGRATHPITHNNKLTLYICGQDGFSDIAARIGEAGSTIDLCCWGFDPGMELDRRGSETWPRGRTFGDLLIDAGKRDVKVRLMVWYDVLAAKVVRNMPGFGHDLNPWYHRPDEIGYAEISARHSVELLGINRNQASKLWPFVHRGAQFFPVPAANIPLLAREEYCHSWYSAAFDGKLKGIELRVRSGDSSAVKRSLEPEQFKAAGLSTFEFEALGMKYLGTHHQKSILIDYADEGGENAVGYVMGLNSVTDYWDTVKHALEDSLREKGAEAERNEHVQSVKGDAGFKTLKPYQDYACRIERGGALIAVHDNFSKAWAAIPARQDPMLSLPKKTTKRAPAKHEPPAVLLRKADPGDSTVQIVRTQPEDGDKTVRDAYWLATATAATAAGYLYIENQYFQSEEWAQHLLTARRNAIRQWRERASNAGRSMEDMPVMHVFIVTPVPEREGMVPRTHDTLATLGQDAGMTGQNKLIEFENKRPQSTIKDEFGITTRKPRDLPAVVQHANSIDKPSAVKLESEFGLRICTAMLNTCAFDNGRWRYREIYIHSKLMIARDVFFMLGSANLNPRSMFVDSELNMAVTDPALARDLRRRVWGVLSGGDITGKDGGRSVIVESFRKWRDRMRDNKKRRDNISFSAEEKRLNGFLLPLEDERNSLSRLG